MTLGGATASAGRQVVADLRLARDARPGAVAHGREQAVGAVWYGRAS
jgi:hypothetical protein